MRPTQIIEALTLHIKARQPVMIHGSPGVGKSDAVRKVANDGGYDLIDLRLSQLDPVDLRGVPTVNAKTQTTLWNTPNFLPRTGKGILFFDEINSASQATQAAAYQLILDRKLGDYTLPPDWVMVAAGNRVSDRAIVNQMSTALRNRFAHLNYEVHNDDWCLWALQNNIAPEVLGFIRFRPMLLNDFEPRGSSEKDKERMQRLKDAQAFATPRSWEFLSRLVAQQPSKDLELELYNGIVGEGPAAEFIGYLKYYRNLPDLDALLLNPDAVKIPTEPAVMYALATGLAARATDVNLAHVVKFILRIPIEFQALTMKDIMIRNPELHKNKAFMEWAVKNSAFMR